MRRPVAVISLLVISGLVPLDRAVAADPGGPIVLMGIDAEDGGPGGHGPITTYGNVVNDILSNVTNGGSGILVIGSGKAPGDSPTLFWNAIGTITSRTITHVNGDASISAQSLAGFEMVGIVSTHWDTGGGLTNEENIALAARKHDIAQFVNSGGGLLGFNQSGLDPLYGYLSGFGSFDVNTNLGYNTVTPTADGAAIGIGPSDLDVCCWHDEYVTFPPFLKTLVINDFSGLPAAIGGKKVIVPTLCTAQQLTASITKPAPGRVYLDDGDIGSAPTGEPLVKGSGLTLTVTASGPIDSADFRIDGASAGIVTSAPFELSIPLPALGQHDLEVLVMSHGLLCGLMLEQTFTVVCVGVTAHITRPATGRAYLGDSDIGAAGGNDPLLLGGDLTVVAATSDPAHTAEVVLSADLDPPFATDTTSPYEGTLSTDALSPGPHILTARASEHTPGCVSTSVVAVRRPDPKVRASSLGVSATSNIPAEPQLRSGGAAVDGSGGSTGTQVAEQTLGPIDRVGLIHDTADGALSPMGSRSASLVTDISLLGGLITADALHARAVSSFDVPSLTGSAGDDGSEIADLRIAGMPVTVSQPNTEILLPGGLGRVVVQETIVTGAGFTKQVTVNMLHAWLTTPSFKGEITVASAYAAVSLPGGPFSGPENDLIYLPDDAGSGRDAGDDASTAVPISEGLFGGAMREQSDTTDVYSFQAGQGDRIAIEMLPSMRERVSVDAGPSPTLSGPEQPDFDLYLYDPDGDLREYSAGPVSGSVPERVELNADIPYTPAGARARWTIEVRRRGNTGGFYSLDLRLPPVPLREQNDAGAPGDAPDSCAQARPLATGSAENDVLVHTGVIRDDDRSDFYTLRAEIGQTLGVTLKPDELADGADMDLFLYAPTAPGEPADCAVWFNRSELGKKPLPKAAPELTVSLPVRTTGDWVFEIRRINAVANYTFEVALVNDQPTLPGNDAGTGADAGDACVDATPLKPGIVQGRLADLPDQDVEDWYAIDVAEGQDMFALLRSADPNDLTLALYTPSCTPASGTLTTSGPFSFPETAHLEDASPGGQWRLRVGSAGGDGGNYMLSTTITP